MADSKMIIRGDVVFFEYVKPPQDVKRVFVWDLDKTYLDTHFENLRGLIRTAFEKAFEKRNIPGTATLVKALTATAATAPTSASVPADQPLPLFFISASPQQMERKVREKLRLDGIHPYGMFFKDNLKNLRFKKFHRLKQQVGYKIQALLELRLELPGDAKQVMFGDDSESDAVVYSLYSDICMRRLPGPELIAILKALHVLPDQLKRILEIQKQLPAHDPVEQIYINLAADTDPNYYSKFGRRVLATFNTFQAALNLFDRGYLDLEQLLTVSRDLVSNYGFTPDELARSFDDLTERGFLTEPSVDKALPALQKIGLIPQVFRFHFQPLQALQALQKLGEKIGEKILGIEKNEPWVPDHIDYLSDFR